MLTIGQCLIVAGLAGLGYEALQWGYSGSWLPMTVDDLYRSLGAYDLLEQAESLRAAASWYLDTPLAGLVIFYGASLSLIGWWRRRRIVRAAVHPAPRAVVRP